MYMIKRVRVCVYQAVMHAVKKVKQQEGNEEGWDMCVFFYM